MSVERVLNSPVADVFRALSEGRLFNNCGAGSEEMEIDFRQGGGYKLFFNNAQSVCCGKFLEIVANQKIVFTWGDQGSDEGFPHTKVSVDLSSEAGGKKTKISILHTGFKTQDEAKNHDYGWGSGLDDLSKEITEGTLRIVRVYPVSRDVLYSACSDPRSFFGIISDFDRGTCDFRVGGRYRFPTQKGEILGEFLEIIPGKKIVLTWEAGCDKKFESPTRVTLTFDDEEDGESSLELVHELLPVDATRNHRQGWEYLAKRLIQKH